MFFLALDQSTSATKALLFDAAGQTLDREARDHAQHYPQPGWVEHDAEEIWANTLTVLRTLVARQAARVADIASLSIANQRETIVIFDRATGRPLAPAIVWQCRRGEPFCAALAAQEEFVHRKTGLKLDPYFSASKLQWLVQHRPELRGQLESGAALIGTIDAYLIYRLTERRVFATDSTNASRTLLFDLHTRTWDDALCRLWQVPRNALPEVRESSATFGETTLEGALPAPLPIRGVMGDSQASLLAQGCIAPGAAKVTFGTGSSLLLNVGATPRAAGQGVLTALAWVLHGEPTYAFEGIIISSGSTLTWLRDQLGFASDIAAIEQLAQAAPHNGGVYLVPAFTGLGLPYWQPKAKAALLGLSSHSDRRHVARAAFESIAWQIRDALEAMRRDAAVPLGALHGDGGPTASRFLMQLTADLTGTELHVSNLADGSAFGAVLAGQPRSDAHASMVPRLERVREVTVYRPRLPAEDARRLHGEWQAAVRRLLNER